MASALRYADEHSIAAAIPAKSHATEIDHALPAERHVRTNVLTLSVQSFALSHVDPVQRKGVQLVVLTPNARYLAQLHAIIYLVKRDALMY
jgi:hypothetical protein